VQKRLNRSRCSLGCGLGWAQEKVLHAECTEAPPGEYNWTPDRMRRRCGLFVNYFDHLLLGRIAVLHVYVDAAGRPSSVICRSFVNLSVCPSLTLVSRAKTVELIEMPFGFRTRVGRRNHVLDGGSQIHHVN